MDLNVSRDWASKTFVDNLCQYPNYPHKKMSHVQCIFILLQVKSPLSCHYLSMWKSSFLFSVGFLLSSRLNNPSCFGLSPQKRCSSSQIIFVAPLWICSNRPESFLCWGPQNWTQHSGGSHKSKAEGQDPLPRLLVTILFMQSSIQLAFWAASVYLDDSYFIFTLLISCK